MAVSIRCMRMGRGRSLLRALSGSVLLTVISCVLAAGTPPAFGAELLSISGITEPIKDVTLSATVAGRIAAVFVTEGRLVKKGEALLELDQRLEALEVERRRLIWESKAEAESAAARVATLRTQFESTRELFNSTHSVSREELDKQELEYKLAVAEQKRIEVEEAREHIEYEMALENLEKRILRSPVDGTVIKLFFEEGETCEENQPLVRAVDARRCLFVCNVEEWVGRTLKKDQTVRLQIRTGSKTIDIRGQIVFVSPVVDPASGLLEVKTEFINKNGYVRPGVSGMLLLKTP